MSYMTVDDDEFCLCGDDNCVWCFGFPLEDEEDNEEELDTTDEE